MMAMMNPLSQNINKDLNPIIGLHDSVIIDPIKVIHVIQVGFYHGIVLSPGRPVSVVALDEMQISWQELGAMLVNSRSKDPVEAAIPHQTIQDFVRVIVGKIEVEVEVGFTRLRDADRLAERRKEGLEELHLIMEV